MSYDTVQHSFFIAVVALCREVVERLQLEMAAHESAAQQQMEKLLVEVESERAQQLMALEEVGCWSNWKFE